MLRMRRMAVHVIAAADTVLTIGSVIAWAGIVAYFAVRMIRNDTWNPSRLERLIFTIAAVRTAVAVAEGS